MGRFDTEHVKPFDNQVLEQMIEDQLITKLDMGQFATVDNQLVENPGMRKVIRKYIGTGNGQTLAMGEGNTEVLGSYWVETPYDVLTYQARYDFYSEQEMDDPIAIDTLAKRMVTDFVNKTSTDVVAELGKATNKMWGVTFGYDCIADANSAFPKEDPTPGALFLLIARKDLAAWKKSLKNELHYVEDFARVGYIGSVDSVNLFVSDAVPQGKAFLATRQAVRIFMKKGFELEAERDANTRKNSVFGRKVSLVALVEDDQAIVLNAAADPRTGYTKLEAEPADWNENYTNYFVYDAVAGAMKANTEASWDKVKANIWSH